MDSVLPAHQTKHLDLLSYQYFNHTFELAQTSDGQTNGTALWLGAQCVSVLLADILPSKKPPPKSTSRMETAGHHRTMVQATSPNLPDDAPAGSIPPIASRPRAIELGSGIGLTALALATLGWDVVATDIASVVSTVLRPNIQRNSHLLHKSGSFHKDYGTVEVCELDWTVEPDAWTWDDPTCIASPGHAGRLACTSTDRSHKPEAADSESSDNTIGPPFDLIVTSDTIYSASSVPPLLRTLHHLCLLSSLRHGSGPDTDSMNEVDTTPYPSSSSRTSPRSPIIYLALENRDPGLISMFFKQAKEEWGFNLNRIPYRRIVRAMERGGLNWSKSDWEGVEIWKLQIGSPGFRRRKDSIEQKQ